MWAFAKRDALQWSSYKYFVVSWFIFVAFDTINYAFATLVIQLKIPQALEQGCGREVSYLAFFVAGWAFNFIVDASLGAPKQSINPWNLEWLLLSPVTLLDVIVGTSWFWYLLSLFQIGFALFFGIVNGAVFHIDPFSALAVSIMGVASMWGLGMASTGIQVVTKRWDPIAAIFSQLGWLLSGLFFPISLLPSWVQSLSWLLPQSYILEMARQSMLAGKSIFQMGMLPVYLLAYSVIALAIGSWVFLRCVRVAKRQGTISFF